MLLIDSALRGNDHDEEMEMINDYLVALMAPKNFDPDDNANIVLLQEKGFEKICAAIEDMGVSDPGKLSVWKFYNKIEYFKNKPKQKNRSDKENI